MMLRSRALGAVALLALAACTAHEEAAPAASEAEVISLVPGGSITSPNAKPTATYLSVRSIENLRQLSALPGVLADLAVRTDGILATRPPDGRLSVQELLQIEKPGFIETLFPEERAALPQLWALMETSNATPSVVTVPDASSISVTDVSANATSPIEPTNLTIASLPSDLQRSAKRLELTEDSDGDANTVTKADLADAIATPAPYLQIELDHFKAIQKLFLERAGTTLAARVLVNAPVATTTTLASWGFATLSLQSTLDFSEQRQRDHYYGNLTAKITGHVAQRAVVTLTNTVKLLVLDTGTEKETLVQAGTLQTEAGTKTVEVWNNGTRVGSYRANLPNLKVVDTNVDLSQYADYAFTLADGTVLARNAVTGTQREIGGGLYRYDVGFNFATDPTEVELVSRTIVDGSVGPRIAVAPGRYSVPAGVAEGNVTVEIFPEGFLRVTRTNGSIARAVYGEKFFRLSGGDLVFAYDPATNSLQISRNGTLVYSGPLTGAMRTG